MTITTDHFEKQKKFIFYPGDKPGMWYVARQGNTLFNIFPADEKFTVEDVRLPVSIRIPKNKSFKTVAAASGFVVGLLTA